MNLKWTLHLSPASWLFLSNITASHPTQAPPPLPWHPFSEYLWGWYVHCVGREGTVGEALLFRWWGIIEPTEYWKMRRTFISPIRELRAVTQSALYGIGINYFSENINSELGEILISRLTDSFNNFIQEIDPRPYQNCTKLTKFTVLS